MFDGHLSHVYARYKRAELDRHRERTKWRMAFAEEEAARNREQEALAGAAIGTPWRSWLRGLVRDA